MLSPHAAQRERWLLLGTLDRELATRRPGEPPVLRRQAGVRPVLEPHRPQIMAPGWRPLVPAA